MINPSDPPRSFLRLLAFPLLLCGLGIGAVVLFERLSRDGVNWFGEPRSDFRTIPPEWITYRQVSVFACPIAGQATCFALLNNSTFVIGSADLPMLSLFDEKGNLLRKIDLAEEPRAVVCGTPETLFADNIVVAHSQNVTVYTAEGYLISSWKLPDKKSDVRSLVLTQKYLFAADTGKRCIYRLGADGNIDLTFGENFVVYATPITMSFSPKDDLLYISNPGRHRVEAFTQDGECKPELFFGKPSVSLSGFVGCCNPIALATLDDGRILTVEKSVSRAKIYSEGKLDGVVAGPGVLDHYPPEVKRPPAEPGGRYFSAVSLSGERIAVFDFSGQVIRIFEPRGS